jgi:cytochrome P450
MDAVSGLSLQPPPFFDPFDHAVRLDPYPVYRELRRRQPVQFNPHARLWTVTRYADCLAVLRGRRFSSEQAQGARRRREELSRSMLTVDPPVHFRLRAPFAAVFGRKAMAHIREHVRDDAMDLLAHLRDQEAIDLVAEFARPLITRTFVRLLGVPDADESRLGAWIGDASASLDPLATPDNQARAAEASRAMAEYLGEAIASRREDPRTDLLGLAADVGRQGGLTKDEVLTACMLFVIGGHDPSVHLVGNGTLTLLRHPDQRRRLVDNPGLLAAAVEEILRFESPIQSAARVAVEDSEVGGTTISKGQLIVVLLGAANRDPAAFAEPEHFDVAREPNRHLGLGAGVHLCLGGVVARMIGQGALDALLAGAPEMGLADEPIWAESFVPRGLRSLPVTLVGDRSPGASHQKRSRWNG